MRQYFSTLLFCTFVLLSPSLLYAQSSLDTPLPGDFLSGIGYARGWKCTAGALTFTVDNGPAAPLSYGSSRADTQGICGHSNTGFIAQENWNLVGTGQHTIRVFDNGVQFAEATFTVTTLGGQFLVGLAGATSLNFAGQNVTLTWQEDQQNFVITSAGGGGSSSDLSSLIGTWEFTFIIISAFHDHYNLQSIQIQNGIPFLVGMDLDDGGPVAAAKVRDLLPGTPLPFTFALLDPDGIICDFFLFNMTGTNTISGQYYALTQGSNGQCSTLLSSNAHPMSGIRLSTASAQAVRVVNEQMDHQKMQEATSSQTLAASEEETAQVSQETLSLLLQKLQGR